MNVQIAQSMNNATDDQERYAILAGFANRLFALPPKLVKMKWIELSPGMVSTIDLVGQWIFFIAVGIFGGWIIFTFLTNLGKLREE